MEKTFKALLASESGDGKFKRDIVIREIRDLPENDTLIRVHFSGLNYKDALSASGNRGVTRNYPHQPGIDASGIVEECKTGLFQPGDEVLVTGYDLGMNTDGGFGEYIRVPSEWVVSRPENLNLEECMIYGTAGFTAALGIDRMLRMGQDPKAGPVVVTGASGGVGSMAVSILSGIGYDVLAATGKTDAHDYLKELGAKEILPREDVDDQSGRPLLRPKWAGAFDTVGGNILDTLLKACSVHGNVASCGNALSFKLQTTVFPFILNGVNLLGVNSATCPMQHRKQLWNKLSGEWKVKKLDLIKKIVTLDELEDNIELILRGGLMGRVVIGL
jgi:putative YhdH/YhfP family quinone oxidoreductase